MTGARSTARTVEVDHVVVGLGGIGSAAAYWLSRLADDPARVVGLEQFELGHVRGASHDHSRIIRRSYHTEHYVRLTAAAYDAWTAVSEQLGEPLVVRTGGIDLFPHDAAIPMHTYTESMDAAGVPYEVLDAGEVVRRYPPFRLDDGVTALYQDDTGIAPAARGTRAHQDLARRNGAVLHEHSPVTAIRSDGHGEVVVIAGDTTYVTGSVVVAADAWAGQLLAPLGVTLPLEVTREQVVYYRTANLAPFAAGRFPVWIWMDEPSFYGFPIYGVTDRVKAAEDVGGQPTTADGRSFDPDHASLARLGAFLAATLPALTLADPQVTTCLYTLTPDRDFVLDDVPGHPGVQVALGAGHGFKFASWFGRTLAERACARTPPVPTRGDLDLTPFRLDRPGLTDPGYRPNYFV